MSLSDGLYNPKGALSRFADFFKLAADWAQFGHIGEAGSTFGFPTGYPGNDFRVHQRSPSPPNGPSQPGALQYW